MKVLLTNAGSATAIAIIKSLERTEVEVHGADMDPFCVASAFLEDRLHMVPSFSDVKAYSAAILNTCIENNITLIIPCTVDEELLFYSQNQDHFIKHDIVPMCSSRRSIEICHSKVETLKFALGIGTPCPQTYTKNDISSKSFPLLLKSNSGNGSEYVRKIQTDEELQFFLKITPDPIIQEYVTGPEYTIDSISDISGKVLAMLCRRRVQVKSGISVKAHFESVPEYESYTKNLLESLQIVGPANTQFKGGKFIEINPRFSGGLGLSIATGINLPEIAIKVFSGKKIQPSELKHQSGIYVGRYFEEVLIDG